MARLLLYMAMDATDESMVNEAGHTAWVSPSSLNLSWQPAFFAPEYESLERRIAEMPERFQTLGSLLDSVPAPRTTPDELPEGSWLLRMQAGEIMISPVKYADARSAKMARPLPAHAIVLSRSLFRGLQCLYWDEALVMAKGFATEDLMVLSGGRTTEGIAWIAHALLHDDSALQVRRLSHTTSSLPAVTTASVLALKIPLPNLGDRQAWSDSAVERTRRFIQQYHTTEATRHAVRALRPVFLTGATFEERITQFEQYLLDEPAIDPTGAFFVEASTSDRQLDLFVVRRLRPNNSSAAPRTRSNLTPQQDPAIDSEWRDWYWGASRADSYRVFNSLTCRFALPAYLLVRMIGGTEDFGPSSDIVLPSFSFFRSVAEVHGQLDAEGSDLLALDLAEHWVTLQQQTKHGLSSLKHMATMIGLQGPDAIEALPKAQDFREGLHRWLRQVYRPAIAVRVFREAQPVGVYVLFGHDLVGDPLSTQATLEAYGEALSQILHQPAELVTDAARRESLRRLSWVMHQINGPVGRAVSALDDLAVFAARHADTASMLVPDEESARKRADLTQTPLRQQSLSERLQVAIQAVKDVGRITERIRLLRVAQGNTHRVTLNIADLVRRAVRESQHSMPTLRIEEDCEGDLSVVANETSLSAAINEVLHNACREMTRNQVAVPTIRIRLRTDGHRITIAISDNGLPAESTLIRNPFDENASTYHHTGAGSGLGLAIVRETFIAHSGRCSLVANLGPDGLRTPGVTFEAQLPTAGRPDKEIQTHV